MKVLLKRWLRKWRKIVLDVVSGIGIFWLFVEIAINYSNSNDPYLKNMKVFFLAFSIILLIAAIKNKPKNSYCYSLRGKDNQVEVRVCDAFNNRGSLVVPVNHHFDMSLGGNVLKANSIQKNLITKFYAGKVEHLDTDISKVVTIGNSHDIGKTIEIEQNGKKFYLVVNSIKKANNRVKSEIDDLVQSLNGLWQYIALESSRDSVVTIPLMNTQHGRDSYLSKMGSLKEIITSYIEASKELNICEKLIISVLPSDVSNGLVDLDEIDFFLKFSCKHYRQLTLKEQMNDPDTSSKIIRIDN
jgi:hypothetical protein